MGTSTPSRGQNSVVKSAIYFASGTLSSRIFGLIRDALLVAVFGKTVSDAWLAAFRFPNLFRRIFGEGALSACFIPLYVEYREQKNERALAQLTAGIFSLLLIVLIPLNVAIVATMDSLVPLWVSGKGFAAVPGKMELTITMTKIMFPFLLLVCLYAFFMAILNAHKKFLLSSLAPTVFNLTIIIASVICYHQRMVSGDFLAWSVIVGGVAQFLILIPSVLALKAPWDFSWSSLSSTPVKRTLRAFFPSVLGLGVVQFMGFMNVNFASQLEEGAVTYIYLADRLLELPLSLVAVSLGTALLPTLAEKASASGREAFAGELAKNLRLLLYLCIPASVGMWMTAELLVRVLFERGAFDAQESLIVTGIVKIYALTLLGASVARIMSQAFYAHKSTMIPALAAFIGLVWHLLAAPPLMEEYGLYGLVGSTAVASLLNCFFLFVIYYWRYGTFHGWALTGFCLKSAVASLGIVACCWVAISFMPSGNFWERLITLLVAVGGSVIFYFVMSMALGLNEARAVLRRIKR